MSAWAGCGSSADAPADGSSAPTSAPAVSTPTAETSGSGAGSMPELDGAATFAKFQCNRCHAGVGAPAPPEKHCVGCHISIADGTFKLAKPDDVRGWKRHVEALRFVPSLSGVGTLVSEAWVASYLRRPFDLRPHLYLDMPRLEISEAEADAVARYLAAQNVPATARLPEDAARGDVERGRALFAAKACGSCHRFSGARLAEGARVGFDGPRDHVLAPDLRFTRERAVPGRLVPYLLDPTSIKSGAAMPKQRLSVEQARDLAAFVLEAPLQPVEPARRAQRLPLLDRPVTYDEVAARTFRKICWHCHSQPDYARGDGGPGNTGGFGFAGRGLDLSSYESMSAGILDANGERQSIFSVGPSGRPLLVDALLARQDEVAGERGLARGMPLGLAPLSAEDIQLVESWIAQGRPR